jgi:hypothetical protein
MKTKLSELEQLFGNLILRLKDSKNLQKLSPDPKTVH